MLLLRLVNWWGLLIQDILHPLPQVPQDQPVAALDMVSRWLKDIPLAKGK
jgi:hypothetical protein